MFFIEDDDIVQHDLDHSPDSGFCGGNMSPLPETDHRGRADSQSSVASFASGGRALEVAIRTNKDGIPLYTPPHMRAKLSPNGIFKEKFAPGNELVGSCPLPNVMKVPAMAARRSPRKAPSPKHRTRTSSITAATFADLYTVKGDTLGRGANALVRTCVNNATGVEYAVKVIDKRPALARRRVLKEIENFHECAGHPNIVQLIEFFEEPDHFYLIFEKMHGGPLLAHIQRQGHFTERQASMVTKDIAAALSFLHDRGIAHRDIKPENILCVYPDQVSPVKLCDLDLASTAISVPMAALVRTPELQSPVGSAEFMAPEVVGAFIGEALGYDKRCDLWSLGVIIYVMLCGYPPFYGQCENENCGWDQGDSCTDCQESLFARIQLGEFEFPWDDWDHVSGAARDLIKRLLVKEAKRRPTAEQVLRHVWVAGGAPETTLQTADVLLRNDSTRDMHQLQQNFSAAGRVLAAPRDSWRRARAHVDESPLVKRINSASQCQGTSDLKDPGSQEGLTVTG